MLDGRALLCAACALFAWGHSTAASIPDGSPPSILVSRQLATRAGISVGDVVTLATDPTGASGRTFRVAGIYEPTPDPMRFTAERLEARVHLPDLIDITADAGDPASRESVGAINISVADAADIEKLASDLATRLPGVVVRPTARPPEGDPFAVLDRFHLAISAVTMVGGTAFLLALMVIRAEERRETVGILRLIGVSRRSLLMSVAFEGLLVAILGALFGVVLAYSSEGIVNRVFQARYDTALVFVRVTPSIAMRAIAVAAPLGIAAGITASWTMLRREVLSLFRR